MFRAFAANLSLAWTLKHTVRSEGLAMWRAQHATRAHAVCYMRAQYPHTLIRQPDQAAPAVVEVQQLVVCGRVRAEHDERARVPHWCIVHVLVHKEGEHATAHERRVP